MAKPVILVIDDDAPILTLMENVLRGFGFEARVAASAKAALDVGRSTTPDLILLDKNMPGASVHETIASLRRTMAHVPILILSGEPLGAAEIAELGATGSVMKPFDVVELVERLRAMVGVAK